MWLLIVYIALTLLAILFAKNFAKFLFNRYSKTYTYNSYSDFIACSAIENHIFILNRNSSYSAILTLEGASYYEAEDLESAKKEALAQKSMALNLKELESTMQIKFFFKRFKKEDSFINKNYIELTCSDKKELETVANRLVNGLGHFKARILKDKELIEFLYSHSNLLHREITDNTLEQLKQGVGELFKLGHKKYFKCFSVDFGSLVNDKYFLDILTANFECEYIINSKFFNKIKASGVLSVDKKNITASSEPAVEGQFTGTKGFMITLTCW